MGVDCVMYAMDYPYQYVPEAVQMTEQVDVGSENMEKLFQANAERAFNL